MDCDFDSREACVIELRLHQPVDVLVLVGTFKDAKDLCFIDGSLKYRAQIACFSLQLDGTVPVLRRRLNTHLQTLAAELGNSKLVQAHPLIEKPNSTCAASENILLCADDSQK